MNLMWHGSCGFFYYAVWLWRFFGRWFSLKESVTKQTILQRAAGYVCSVVLPQPTQLVLGLFSVLLPPTELQSSLKRGEHRFSKSLKKELLSTTGYLLTQAHNIPNDLFFLAFKGALLTKQEPSFNKKIPDSIKL